MQTNAEARKGIRTKAGRDMANKRFQLDQDKADLDKDGKLSNYEKERGEAVQKAIKDGELVEDERAMEMACGGMPLGMDTGIMVDPETGNEIPIGSSPSNVRDDIDIMISEGEYVLPADVVKWHGLKHIMEMQSEAKMGLMSMYAEGLIQYVEEEESDATVCPECDGEGCDHCDGKGYHEEDETIETPDGNEIEVAQVEVDEEDPEYEESEDYEESDYGSEPYGTITQQRFAFIV